MSKKRNLREQDPFLLREQQKYTHALPSREWIIEILKKEGVPVAVTDLEKILSIKKEEHDIFQIRLRAMVRDGQIHINRRGGICVADKIDLITCRVEGHKNGYGFGIPLEDDSEDFVLNEKQMRSLMHGDIIAIRPTGYDKRGRREGRVLEVLERAQKKLVALAYWEYGMAVAVALDKRIVHSIVLPNTDKQTFSDGQVVEVEIISYPSNNRPAIGKITQVLGSYADDGMEIEIALRKHDLPYQFSDECLVKAEKIADKVKPSERKNREDLRDLPLVTIDGDDSRDFDDAVFAQKIGRNWRLVVAIADVSHYVKPFDAIDIDARERATSVYFPRRVIPMLPEKLSNGICSLNPDVERLSMVCDATITYAGNIKEYRFYPAIIRSHARLTYNKVWQQLCSKEDYPFKTELVALYNLFKVLLKKRQQRGAMDFDSIETRMIFGDNGKIEKIVPSERNDAHRIIEECMLVANVCAADLLYKNQSPTLYRVHEPPHEDKLNTLREQLSLLGLYLSGKTNPSPKDYAKLAQQISERPDRHIIQIMLLKSMRQAVYQPENKGHFGLAYDCYTHFTSPIRRYPDLLVHRAIKAILQGKKYHEKSWQQLGTHCSHAERRADDASHEVERWLKTYFMKDKIGEIFEGTVSGMTEFGLFVTLDNVYVDGMIHVSDLGRDYFRYRPEILAIEGERTRQKFSIGDKLTVRIAQADLETCRIDLTLAEQSAENEKNKQQRNKRPTRTKTSNRKIKR
ncbi:MAG: ribonuclease R [Neisseriaceae bacterium]|nr:ribonuclease R [Neisseriaceae bacterium]